MNRNKKLPLDGHSFVLGMITLLKQFHSTHTQVCVRARACVRSDSRVPTCPPTQKFLQYLGQYVRSAMRFGMSGKGKGQVYSTEVKHILIFLDTFCSHSTVPRSDLDSYIPTYVFDRLERSTRA